MDHAARKRALPWLLTALVLGLGGATQEQFTGHASPALQTPASGSCQLVRWPAAAETHYAAMNYLQWEGSHYCGRCIEVWCGVDSPKEIVHVVDWCRDCQHNDLRLSSSVLQALAAATGSKGDIDRYEVQWRFVRCPEASDLSFQVCLITGRSSHSLAIQPVNPVEPIRSIVINGVEAVREFPELFYSVKDAQDVDLKRVRLTITTQSGATTENTISLESGECVRVDTTRPTTQSVSAPRPRIRRGDGTAAMERSRNLGESSSSAATITSTTTTTTMSSQSFGSATATAGPTEGNNVSCSNVVRSSGSNSGLDGFALCQTTTNGSSSATNNTASASTSGSTSTAPVSVASSGSGPTTAPSAVTSRSGSGASPSTTTPTTASGSASSTATAASGSTSTASTSTTTTETTTDTTIITATTTAVTGATASQTAAAGPYQGPQVQSTTSPPSETSFGSSTASLSSTSSSTPSSTDSHSATEESFSLPPVSVTNQVPAVASTSSAATSINSNSALQAFSSSSAHTLSASGPSSIDQSNSGSGSQSDAASTDDSSSQSQVHQSAEGSVKSNGTAVGSASNATDPNSSGQTSMGDIFTSPLFFAALLLGIVGCAGSCAAYRAKQKSLLSSTPRYPVVFTPTDIESSMEVHASDPPYGPRTSRSSSVVSAMSNDLLTADIMLFPSATL